MRRLSLQSSSPLLPHSHHYENGKDKHSSITTFRVTAILCLFILAVLVVNAHITITNLREQLSEAQEGETLKETAEKKWSGLLDQEKELRQAEIQKRVELEGELETFRRQYESCNIREKQKEATKYPLPSPNYPIDFERMYPDMFGPRPTPLIPGQKILFMMAVGKNAKSNLDTIINMLGLESVTYMLFHYDDVSFAEYSWNHDVIHVTMYHQMKWWYIKRFVHPDVAKFYEYVYIMDEDCILPAHWNNTRFLEIARRNQLDIFQPSHNNSEHKIINTRKGGHAGRFTDFVEVGPFTIFSVKGYNCVWNMLLPDVVGGWGYDLFFANYCKLSMGIVDAMPIYHGDTKTASKERHDGAEREQNAVLSRYEGITHTWFGKMKTKGYFY